MADEKNLNETKHLLMQAVERINELEHSRTPTPPPQATFRSGASGEASGTCRSAYPYRPIVQEVQVNDAGHRRRLSLSLKPHSSRQRPANEQESSRPGTSLSLSSNNVPLSASHLHRPPQLLSVKQERHSLFQPYSGRSTRGKQPKSKKPKRLVMWKRHFVCLALTGQNYVPGSVEKAELINSGLGCKQLTFFEHGSSWEFHDELVEAFPKLENAGGYELLRTEEGNSRDLVVIPQPSEGYTASYLKNVVQHAKIYVRPLQQNLTLDTQATDEDEDDVVLVS